MCAYIRALVIQHEKHIFSARHYIVICGGSGCTFFPHYPINGTILRKKLLNIKCVFRFSPQLLCETFLTLRRNKWDMIKNVRRSSCKVPVIIVRFWWNLNFLNRCLKSTQILNSMKIYPVGTKLFHADGQMERWHTHIRTHTHTHACAHTHTWKH